MEPTPQRRGAVSRGVQESPPRLEVNLGGSESYLERSGIFPSPQNGEAYDAAAPQHYSSRKTYEPARTYGATSTRKRCGRGCGTGSHGSGGSRASEVHAPSNESAPGEQN